ncbi:hypothetical protein MMC25_006017 [Agyrium rufum]|nr:hypothetical protein [Agyrium rufum]
MASDASLYGARMNKLSKSSSTISTSSLAFSSTLTALISQNKPTSTTSARARPAKQKDDIFSTHNKNAKKRAVADLSDGGSAFEQKHSKSSEEVDASTLHRSKRRMEEKARLYAAMKRGDYLPKGGDSATDERLALVDFDRKWAEDEASGKVSGEDTSSDDGGDSEPDEMVEFVDEFGRRRMGSKKEAEREQRRQRTAQNAEREAEALSARPSRPEGVIYGNTVQAAAFNPDETITEQMETLAKKRDRSMTPPEEVHYDATKEVRTKGVGFYAFSKDKEGREKEMENLEMERIETERRKEERVAKKNRRKREIEERRKILRAKRDAMEADRFLQGLDGFVQESSQDQGEK